MKNFYILLAVVIVLLFSTEHILAADSDFKNNLLKIELSKIDDSHYNIGLYTRKAYNEPVKVIKKTDTIYYFLLPETDHSITSVTPMGDIQNVLVKSYPYAGQDLNNGYTKVAIITSKPLTLTTSTKTPDTAVSPRLDPLRLARLDEVFERYAQRLADNNIPTPLAEFRKASATEKIASAASSEGKTTVSATVAAPASKTSAQTAARVSAATPVKTSSIAPVKTAVSAPLKTTSASQTVSTAAKKAATTKAAVTASKGIPPAKAVSSGATQATADQKPVLAANTIQKTAAIVKTVQNPAAPVQTAPAVEKLSGQAPVLNEVQKQAIELEKQLADTKPVDVEFAQTDAIKTIKMEEGEQAPGVVPVQKPQTGAAASKTASSAPKNSNTGLLLLAGIFFALLYSYIKIKNANIKKKMAQTEVLAAQNAKREGIKELLKNRVSAKQTKQPARQQEVLQPSEILEQVSKQVSIPEESRGAPAVSEPETIRPAIRFLDESDGNFQDSGVINKYDVEEFEPLTKLRQQEVQKLRELEKARAFDAHMDTVSLETEFSAQITPQTEDDIVLQELCTPIESKYTGEVVAEYNQNPHQEEVAGSETATIVSSSKLTETRGLYLAKFEGATSLVGYIQDDIYVLYNFGDVEMGDTDIQSQLAQESATDSLYIVKTGGKKLMVKSTPYDMSLEMVI